MNLPEGTHLSYTVFHEAWYASAPGNAEQRPAVSIQAAHPGGGVTWEFQVELYDFGEKGTAIRLGAFDDAFAAFAQLPEFFSALGERQPTTLAEVQQILDSLGAADETPRVSPYP